MYRWPVITGILLAALSGCATVPPLSGTPENAGVAVTEASPGSIGFFIIGDTGVLGDGGNLALTSALVRQECAGRAACDFGLMSGDNIYPNGATGDPDKDGPTFQTLFVEPFGSLWGQQAPADPRFFVALGNHDWYNGRAGADAQLRFHEATRPFYMDGFFYSRQVAVQGRTIEIFVLDSEMLLSPHTLVDYDRADDGSMVATDDTDRGGTEHALPITDQERQQAAWFADALAKSTADWKLVLAHHPIWQSRSDSKFAQSQKLRELILPALCRDADAYFAGHQHTIEVFTDSCATVGANGAAAIPLPQIVSGAGAKARNVDPAFAAWQARLYPQARQYFAQGETAGYVQAEIVGDTLRVTPVTATSLGSVTRHTTYSFAKRTGR